MLTYARDARLAALRHAGDVLLRSCSNCQTGGRRLAATASGGVLARVLTLAAHEGHVPPARARVWQPAGAYVQASAADVRPEALQLQRMLLPALRLSLARQVHSLYYLRLSRAPAQRLSSLRPCISRLRRQVHSLYYLRLSRAPARVDFRLRP
jgi:hypothetical protein